MVSVMIGPTAAVFAITKKGTTDIVGRAAVAVDGWCRYWSCRVKLCAGGDVVQAIRCSMTSKRWSRRCRGRSLMWICDGRDCRHFSPTTTITTTSSTNVTWGSVGALRTTSPPPISATCASAAHDLTSIRWWDSPSGIWDSEGADWIPLQLAARCIDECAQFQLDEFGVYRPTLKRQLEMSVVCMRTLVQLCM